MATAAVKKPAAALPSVNMKDLVEAAARKKEAEREQRMLDAGGKAGGRERAAAMKILMSMQKLNSACSVSTQNLVTQVLVFLEGLEKSNAAQEGYSLDNSLRRVIEQITAFMSSIATDEQDGNGAELEPAFDLKVDTVDDLYLVVQNQLYCAGAAVEVDPVVNTPVQSMAQDTLVLRTILGFLEALR